MRFRNSLRLMMENFKQVYKLLFSQLAISLVASALCCAFVLPELIRIWNHTEVQTLVEQLKEFFSFSAFGSEDMNLLKDAIFGKDGSASQVATLLGSMVFEITLTVVGCAVVYLLKRFAETICYFSVGSVLNDRMSTYAETGFFTSLVANLGKASVYAVVYVPIVFVFDVLMLGFIWLLLYTLPLLPALFFAVTALVVLQAFKLTATSTWLPAMNTDDKKLRQALKHGNKAERTQQYKNFFSYVVAVYFIIILNVIAAITTFGSALLITVPASYFFLICMQYVNYYTMKGKKYFLTFEHIATNPDHGDREHYFDYMSEEEKTERE